MGAFWDGWNRQGQINQQQALSGLQQVRGIAGLMQEAQAMQQQQAVRGLLADTSIPDEQKIPALLRAGPAGIEVAGKLMQVQKGQQEAERARRVENFWQNEAPKYNTPAQDEIRSQALPGGLMGPALPGQGGLLQEAKPAGVDIEGLVRAGAAAGAVSPEAVFRIESDKQNRVAQREAMLENRRMQIEAQIEAARQRGEDARRIAQMQIDGRADLARLAAGLRPPRQEQPRLVYDAQRGVVVDLKTGTAAPAMSPEGVPLTPKETSEDKQRTKLAAGLPQAKQRVALMEQNIDRLDTAIKELEEDPGLSNITGSIAGRTPNITNDATTAQAKLNSIKSQIFVNALQAMRESSKTGGAVGNVSDKEGDKLERVLGALDQAQGTESFKSELKKVRQQLKLSKEIIQQAFVDQYGDVKPASGGAKRINGDAEYNALPKGARYIGPDNIERVKP